MNLKHLIGGILPFAASIPDQSISALVAFGALAVAFQALLVVQSAIEKR